MARTLKFPALLLSLFLVHDAYAEIVTLAPFSAKEEWTFRQVRTRLGQTSTNDSIEFSTLFKNNKGQLVLGWAKAITDAGQTVWQPIGSLAAPTCIYDFVGSSNLGLTNACAEGLLVGASWQNKTQDSTGEELATLTVDGFETVSVPAGKFRAIKITGDGRRQNKDHSAEKLSITYWFATGPKALVRTSRTYSSVDGKVLMEIVEELVAYKGAD